MWKRLNLSTDRAFYKNLFRLMLPVVLQNMITIGVNIMDNVMLGSYGEIQLSGCSLANDFITIFHILCMGMGCGAAVLTAQFFGKQDWASIRKAVAIMLRICLGLVLVFTLATALFPRQIMGIYTPDLPVIEKGVIYFYVSLPTYLLMGISMTLTLVLRSVGKVTFPLITSIVSFFANVFFNWVFIFGHLGMPELQIAGAALGTVLARVVEVCMIGFYFFKKEDQIAFRLRDLFLPCRDLLPTYLNYSIPVILSDALLALGNSAVSVVVGHISTEFVAANAIIATIVRLSTVFASGLGQASAAITGNTLGRGEVEKTYTQAVTMVWISTLLGILAGVIILILAPWIIGLYDITETTRVIATQMMYVVAIMVIFQAMQSVLTKGVLRGGGDTHFCMRVDALFLWLASVPLGILCGIVWGMPPYIVYFALKIDWAIKSFLCLFRLKSRKWMRRIQVGG